MGSNVAVKPCIVAGCRWKHEIPPPPNVNPIALASVFGSGTMQDVALARYNEEIETTLREHLERHTLVEWAQTVMTWRARSEAAHTRILELEKEKAELELELDRLRTGPR